MEKKPPESAVHIITTLERREDAESLAASLVEKKLAACVQIAGPIYSVYRWKDRVERAEEWQCHIKTREALYAEVEAAIKAVHPYETPEITAWLLVHGSREYLAWLHEQTTA